MTRDQFLRCAAKVLAQKLGCTKLTPRGTNVQISFVTPNIRIGVAATQRDPEVRVHIYTDDSRHFSGWKSLEKRLSSQSRTRKPVARIGPNGTTHYIEFSWKLGEADRYQAVCGEAEAAIDFFVNARNRGAIP